MTSRSAVPAADMGGDPTPRSPVQRVAGTGTSQRAMKSLFYQLSPSSLRTRPRPDAMCGSGGRGGKSTVRGVLAVGGFGFDLTVMRTVTPNVRAGRVQVVAFAFASMGNRDHVQQIQAARRTR